MIKRKISVGILISSFTLCAVTFLQPQDSFALFGVPHNEELDHARHLKIKMKKKLKHAKKHHDKHDIHKYEKKVEKTRNLVKALKHDAHKSEVKSILEELGEAAIKIFIKG